MYYTHGIPYIVMVLSQVWVALMVVYFGNKIRILAKKKGYMSLGDYLQDRFNSKYLKVLASCISVLMTMVFLSMQYVGNARAMSIVSGNAISYTAAIIVSILFSLMIVLIGEPGALYFLSNSGSHFNGWYCSGSMDRDCSGGWHQRIVYRHYQSGSGDVIPSRRAGTLY